MLGGWQGTFCAGISTHNIERGGGGGGAGRRLWGGVRVVDYVVNVRSFDILSLIVTPQLKPGVSEL